jgi:hypothetical protein
MRPGHIYKVRGIATARKLRKMNVRSTKSLPNTRWGAHCPHCPECSFAKPKVGTRCDGHVYTLARNRVVRCLKGHAFTTC